jgi:glycosyltransferase involved in cell wall biosynthesis
LTVKLALLVSPESFERFYEEGLGLDRRTYVESYRNDFVWDYARALREHGVETSVYIPSHRQDGIDHGPDGFAVRFLKLLPPARITPVSFRHLTGPLQLYATEMLHTACLLPSLRRGLREDGIDVLYVQEYWTGRFDVLVRRLPLPVVAGEQGGSGGGALTRWKPGSFRRANGVICQTRTEVERLRGYGADAVVIPNGVDDEFFSPELPPEERPPLVIMVARLDDEQKRVSDAIRALALLPEPWRLKLIGSGRDEEALRELARTTGVADRVEFAGFVFDKEEIRRAYRTCGVFALPSTYEGMPVSALEAMSCGAPVVVSRLKLFEELVEDGRNGCIVPMRDPPALAGGILRAYAARAVLGPAARETVVRSYSRQKVMAALATLLREAADGSGG